VGSYHSGNAAFDEIINNAPVAPPELVAAYPWAAAVRATGALRVGGLTYSPLFWEPGATTGTFTGFDAGLALLLSRYLLGDAAIEVVPVTPTTAESMLRAGSVDTVIAQYTITSASLEQVMFSGPYYLSGSAVLVGSDTPQSAQYPTPVAVVAGSIPATQLPETTTALPLPAHAQCVSALLGGNAAGYLTDESLAIATWAANPTLKIASRIDSPADAYGIALPRNSDVKTLIDHWLADLIADGTWAKLWQVTIGQAGGEAPTPPTLNSAGNLR
jgi:glutamate transport system substrate-binding protein